MISPTAQIYVALGAVVLVIWWAYTHEAINPVVTETGGSIGTGAQ